MYLGRLEKLLFKEKKKEKYQSNFQPECDVELAKKFIILIPVIEKAFSHQFVRVTPEAWALCGRYLK